MDEMDENKLKLMQDILEMIKESNHFMQPHEIKLEVPYQERTALIHHLKEMKLIDVWADKAYIITLKGLDAHKMGIDKYLEELKEKEKLEIRQLKGNVFQVNKWWVILFINIILSGIVSYILLKLTEVQ